MKSFKKFLFLFLSLVLGGQFLFASNGGTERELFAINRCVSYAEAYRSVVALEAVDKANENAGENSFAGYTTTISKQVAKPKKKVKRLFNSSTRLRPPVKELALVSVNIFTKETYSKPFFLSHLHYFLFRLTPF